MVGAKGKNISSFYFLRAFFHFNKILLSEQVFQKRRFKKKGGYPWIHKRNYQNEFATFY